MTLPFSARVTTAPDVMFRMVGDEGVLLNLNTQLYLGLNPVGARMWNLLVEAPNVQSAFDTLLAEYDVEPSKLRKDIQEFIDNLTENGLVEIRAAESAAGAAVE